MSDRDFEGLRAQMVQQQIVARGIRSAAVVLAMGKVKRERFVPPDLQRSAYLDRPLPIGQGQTISQPYIVSLMTEVLELNAESRVLEVGTGSGYAAAVLAEIARAVYTIERHEELAREATRRLSAEGYTNISVRHGDGTLGWVQEAPFDAIVVTAAARQIPEALLGQLAVGGRLAMPVGVPSGEQKLVCVRRTSSNQWEQEELLDVRFVPLVGATVP